MVTAIITARANSKGLPGKNMKKLGARPLIQYTFDIASEVTSFDSVILSTDIDEAITLSNRYASIEAPFKRPEHLSEDNTSQLDVVNHVLDFLENEGRLPEYFVLLQPTSPFRTVNEMNAGVNLLKSGCKSVVGVTPVMHHPADYLVKNDEGKIEFLMPTFKLTRRQEFPPVYFNNGAFYGCSTQFFREQKVFYDENSTMLEMGENSLIDIDTEFDFKLAKALIN